jgi:2'-5' RNA ligase
MKIVSVYGRIELIDKPEWLDAYRKKYDNPYELHITLKQSCYIDEGQIAEVKTKLQEVLINFIVPEHKIELDFNELVADKSDGSIMINAKENILLTNLQKEIRISLSNYDSYTSPELKEYEENFHPHITIVFDLSENFDQALKDLKEDYRCEGIIEEIVLSVVNKISIEEAQDPNNLTVYRM